MSHLDIYQIWDIILFVAGGSVLCLARMVVRTNPRRSLNRFLSLICAAFAVIILSPVIRAESQELWQKGLAHSATRIAATIAILGAFLAADSIEEPTRLFKERIRTHKFLSMIALVPTMTIPSLWMHQPKANAVFEWDSLLAVVVISLTELRRRQRLSRTAKYEHSLLMCLIGTAAVANICFIAASWAADHTQSNRFALSMQIMDRFPTSFLFVGTVGFAAQLVMPAGVGIGTAIRPLLKIALQLVAALLAVVAVLAFANVSGPIALLVVAGAAAGVGGWAGFSYLWTTFGPSKRWSRDREVLEIVAEIAKSEADEGRLVARFTALVAQYLSANRIEWTFDSEGIHAPGEQRLSVDERLIELALKTGWVTAQSLAYVALPDGAGDLRTYFESQSLGIILAEQVQHRISVLRVKEAPGLNIYRRTTIVRLKEALQTVSLARERAILAADAMQDRSLVNFGRRVLERAHEDRNYLDALAFAVRLLAEGRESELTAEHRAAVATGFEDYLSLRNLELDLNRPGAIAIELIQAARIADDLGRIYSASARKLGIDFEIVDGDPSLWVQADRRLVMQVLLNLVSNSAKAIAQSPRKAVRIQVVGKGQYVEFQVEDTGPGLSEESARSFVAGPESGRRSGLGLTICQKIAEALGGSIQYMHGDGEIGAVFRMALPRRVAEGEPELTSVTEV